MWASTFCVSLLVLFIYGDPAVTTTSLEPSSTVLLEGSINSPISTPSTTLSAGVGCQNVCCFGRNNTCRSTGLRLNGGGTSYSRCFCDEGCLDMGDCCFDYHGYCEAVNCQVSDWGNYSECSSECGIGIKTRERVITVEPRFGGTPCPQNLRQKTVCSGTNCSETIVEVKKEIEKETARIMPAKFGRFRSMREYNANMDIRKNLFYQYYHKDTPSYSGYCSRFRVVSSRRNCNGYSHTWANVLKKGVEICVQCQQTAMEKERSNGMCAGHGEVGTKTNWNAVNARGCMGWWERLEDDQKCACEDSKSFIFI